MTKTLLWGAEDYSTEAHYTYPNTTLDLNDSLSDYDMICLVISSENDIQSNIVCNIWYDVNVCLETNRQMVIWIYFQRFLRTLFTDTTFTITDVGYSQESSGYMPRIYKIYGYKF